MFCNDFMKKINLGSIYNFVQLTFSIFVSILLLTDESVPHHYVHLWVLPLFTGLLIFFAMVGHKDYWKDVRILILIVLFSARNLYTPFLMFLGNYYGNFTSIKIENVDLSILIYALEELIIILFAIRLSKKQKNKLAGFEMNNTRGISNLLLLVGLSLFCVLTISIHREYMLDYTSLFSGTNIRSNSAGTNGEGALYTLFGVVFPITYSFVSVYLIDFVRKRIRNPFRTIFILALIVIPLLFMSNSDAFNLILALCLASFAIVSKGTSKKFIFISIAASLVVVVDILYMVDKTSLVAQKNNMFENLSANSQAYLTGISNMAGLFNVKGNDKITNFLYDIYAMIPFRNTIIGLQDDYQLTRIYYVSNDTNSQIVPCIGQLFYYFSIFAPLLECGLIYFAFKAYDKTLKANGPLSFFSYCVCFMYLIITPVLYNFTIFMSRFLITILPMILMSYLFERPKKPKIVPNNRSVVC